MKKKVEYYCKSELFERLEKNKLKALKAIVGGEMNIPSKKQKNPG